MLKALPEKFRELTEAKFVQGEQNNRMLFFVETGKKCNLEAQETLAIIKEMWQGKFEPSDERSFWNAWKNPKTEPQHHYGEQRNYDEENEKNDLGILADPFFNIAFKKWLDTVVPKKKEILVTDTSLLKYWYKKGDWIHIVDNKYDSCDRASDAELLFKEEKPLKSFQLMSVAAFEDPTGGRKNLNVKENRLISLESDKMPLDAQLRFFSDLIDFGLPVKSITYSGGKSYHCLLKIHPMRSTEDYKKYCEAIFTEFNRLHPALVDAANKDGVRYTRSPFGYRPDKDKTQKLIWVDEIPMDEETFDFKDTLEQVKDYVKNFTALVKQAEVKIDVNGCPMWEFVSSLSSNCDVEDIFLNNGGVMVKAKGQELQRSSEHQVWKSYNPYIDKSIVSQILLSKDPKHQKITVDDFYFKTKDIVFDISRRIDDPKVYNLYEPGFYLECVNMDVKEMPSEFDKLLDNLADEECKDWLINHMSCYFHLLLNGFNNPVKGAKHPLETVPIFYGKSGTGKNTLMDVLGRAISKKGAMDIAIGQLAENFNEFLEAGLININEAAKGKSERKTTREALKRFTDIWKELNPKFMPKVNLFNGAYKTISANESIFGVLDIDVYDRRFQYITGGWQKNGAQEGLLDMNLFYEQEKAFIAYLIHYDCDFRKAETVFDNTAKIEDKINSMSNVEKVAYWLSENAKSFKEELISVRTALQWYNDMNGTKFEVDPRTLGKLMKKIFTESKQSGKDEGGIYGLKRGEIGYKVSSFVGEGSRIHEL